MSERDRLIALALQHGAMVGGADGPGTFPARVIFKGDTLEAFAAALSQPHASEQGASVLDVGFKYEDGVHTPTVLVGFAVNDWKARDEFAASLAPHAPAPVQAAPTEPPNNAMLMAAHEAIGRALTEAGISNEVLRGMAIEVGLEYFAEQAASPTVDQTMDEAVAAGDGTLHGAIDYWQERALKAEAAVGEQETETQGGHLTITTNREGQCVLVSWQDDEHRILRVVWEADGPYTPHKIEQEKAEFELWHIGDDEDTFLLASAEGQRAKAFSEIMRYHYQYSQDGRVKVFEVSRKEISL